MMWDQNNVFNEDKPPFSNYLELIFLSAEQ